MEYIEQIIGAIGLIVLIVSLTIGIRTDRKFHKELKKNNPQKYKSLYGSFDYERNFKVGLVGIAITIPIIIILIFFGINRIDSSIITDDKKTAILGIAFVIIFSLGIVAIYTIKELKPVYEYKQFKKVFNEQYNKKFMCESNYNKYIVQGSIKELGSIRHQYKFDFIIPDYKCLLTNYEVQRLELTSGDNPQKVWNAKTNILEFHYKGLKQYIHLTEEELNQKLQMLSETRVISIFYDNNDIVIKQTISFSEDQETITNHMNDIEYFYNLLINIINENNENIGDKNGKNAL